MGKQRMEKKCYLCSYPATETCSRWFVTLPSTQQTPLHQKEKKLIVLQVLCCLLLWGAPHSSQGRGQMLPIQVPFPDLTCVVWCGVYLSLKLFIIKLTNVGIPLLKKERKLFGCQPRLCQAEGEGNYLVASRDINAGEVVSLLCSLVKNIEINKMWNWTKG